MTTYTWLDNESQSYSRVSTCLALSASVYAPNSESCLRLLNNKSKYLHHGITDLLFATYSPRPYLIAFKPSTNEVYVAFRGTENLKALLPSLKVPGMPNNFQGRFHSGFKDQADQIPLEPFYYLLDSYPDTKLVFTGHSLGGAIAAIVTSNMLVAGQTDERRKRISCVAFGAPFLCDQECSVYLNERYKNQFHFYINHSDVVPYIFCLLHIFVSNLFTSAAEIVENAQKCENWITKLLHLQSLHTLDEKYEWFTFLNQFISSNDFSFLQNDLKSATYLLPTCFNILKKIVPMYQPFGQCFRTTTSINETQDSVLIEFHIKQMSIDDVIDAWQSQSVNQLIESFINNIQAHFILSYIREIHENVIARQKLAQPIAQSRVKLVHDNDISLLSVFLPPHIERWSWDGSSKLTASTTLEVDNGINYTWSAISYDYGDGFLEISLRLCGPTVSLISELHYYDFVHDPESQNNDHENFSSKMCQKARLQDTNDECTRLFLFHTRKDQYTWLRFRIAGHFGIYDITDILDRRQFKSTTGLVGRKRQIAELSLLDLYKHALSYCLFTSCLPNKENDSSKIHITEDDQRRKEVKKNLLLCEKLQQDITQLIDQTWYKSNPEIIDQVRELILNGQTEMGRFDEFSTSPDIQSTKTPSISAAESQLVSFDKLSLPTTKKKTETLPIKTIPLSDIMLKWSTKPSQSIEIISEAVPMLFAMYLSMTATFQIEAMNALRSKAWTKTQAVIVTGARAIVTGACAIVTFVGADIISYLIWIACMAAVAASASISTIFYRYFSTMRNEYVEVLLLIAQSIGFDTSLVRIHQFTLEKEISDVYRDRIHKYPIDSYIIANWKKFFPTSSLNETLDHSVMQYWLNLIKCVDAHHQLRNLLSQDFAVGVVGGGKTGKSQLLARMFGFPTQPDLNIRTVEMASYRISNEFRVVDFPHMNSSIDALRRCFTCHYSLVNAIIVILNGEQRGDDAKTESYVVDTVKKLAAEPNGVDVLYCFNRCDRLALCRPQSKSNGMKKREQSSPMHTASANQQRAVYWTKEETEKNKIEFATKAYGLKPEKCIMTFFALDNDDDGPEWWSMHDSLKAIGLSTYDDIKNKWLRDVLEKNGLQPESIKEILNFEYSQE